jgi:hypothetical protein
MTLPSVSLAQARQDVREKELARDAAADAYWEARGCSILVHSQFTPGCARCEKKRAARLAWVRASDAFDAALARFDAIESQQRRPLHVGGER